MLRAAIVILASSLVLLAVSASGAVQASWLVPSVLSGAGAHEERVAVDAHGGVTVVWATTDGTGQGVVEAAFRPPGRGFGPPQDISPPGLSAGPDLGVDQAGEATVVWASGSPPSVAVRAATRPAGGSFGPSQNLGEPDANVFSPRVAVNARGDAIVLWIASDGPSYVFRAAFRPAGGSFGLPENVFSVSVGPQLPTVEIALDPKGDAIAIWVASNSPRSVVQAAYRPEGGNFGAPETLAEASGETRPDGQITYVYGARLAIDAAGNAIAAWWNSGMIQAAFRPETSGAWQSPHDLAQAGSFSGGPSVAVDAQGDAIAVWVVSPDGTLQASTRAAASGSWQVPQTVSRPGDRSSTQAPAVAVGGQGDVVLAWTASVGVIVAAVRPAGGRFGPARDISQAGVLSASPPQLAVDPQGNATVIWRTVRSPLTRYSHAGYIQSATYRR